MIVIEVFTLLVLLSQACYGYVDLGDLTEVKAVPTVSVPQPRQLLQERQASYAQPQHPMITAVAPFLVTYDNGTNQISWSTAYHRYSRHFRNARGIFKRHGGILRRDASLIATCTPCSGSGTSGNQSATNVCHTATYDGIFGGSAAASDGTICNGPGYSGVFRPTSTTTSTGLPCCRSCTPIGNVTTTAATTTTGISTSTGQVNGTVTTTIVTSTTVIVSEGSTTTVIIQTSTLPTVTLSITTIIPTTNSTDLGLPIVTTGPNTAIGCGTASGSGTVIGSGTVYLGPGGFFPVTSSGTVSGFASKVIGCGTIIATSGSFEGSATLTGCGTGTGCAILTGSGTVYPDILGGLIGITSSGTISGCGKVVGCGILTGTGTFTVTTPYTTTITPSLPLSTVNVYISYCPPDPLHPFRIGANLTSHPTGLAPLPEAPHNNNGTIVPPFPLVNSTLTSLSNSTNSTNTTADLSNPLCQICPNDSGICCPLFTACGADGHCPYEALQAAGYLRFGVNVVDKRNSSPEMGMVNVQGRVAPGLMWVNGNGTGIGDDLREKGVAKRHGHGDKRRHRRGVGMGRLGRR